jgi:hypothetical protein
MIKWEYCGVFMDGTVVFFTPNGERIKEIKKDKRGTLADSGAMAIVISELGVAGWEAINVYNGHWYFKRQIQG